MEELEDGEGITDLVRDLGGEEAEGGEAFVFSEHIFAFEDTGVEPRVLQGDGAEAGEGGAEALLIVVEAMRSIGEHREDGEHFALEQQGAHEHGAQRGIAGNVREVDEFA